MVWLYKKMKNMATYDYEETCRIYYYLKGIHINKPDLNIYFVFK